MAKKKIGKVITPADANPWPHEERIAKILARDGHIVKFIPSGLIGTADIYLDGIIFEIKSPFSNKENTIEHRLKDAINNQSYNIVFDSSRIKNKPDYSIKNYLVNKMREQKQIKRLIFINKRGEIIDIGKLV